tara:strand:- start:19554 stop:19970 length:417 start_codon:yes stop_codon:yes gene_type:complete
MELYRLSPIVIMVERNLGFESEHHEKALRNLPNCRHRIDHQAKRFGILTTEDIKYGMMTLLNTMLRDNRVNVAQPLLSEDPEGNRRRLKDQMGIDHIHSSCDARNLLLMVACVSSQVFIPSNTKTPRTRLASRFVKSI